MSAALKTQGIRAVPLAVGREEAIRLGKQYVHNDICFPAQIVIGEALAALRSGQYVPSETAIGMGKYIGDCRLTHYSALLRKALDDAGYPEVAILTNDDVDYHDLLPDEPYVGDPSGGSASDDRYSGRATSQDPPV